MIKNIIYNIVTSVVVSAIAVWGFISMNPTPVQEPLLGGQTHFSGLVVGDSGLTVTGATSLTGAIGTTGKVTTNAGHLRSYTNSTSSTATTQTLAVGDILNYDTVLFTPNVGAITLTFPASSTMSTLVPTAGDMQETCFINSTSTTAAIITFAASTGIDMETASSSLTLTPKIYPNNGGCFKFIRQKATAAKFDISVEFTPFTDAD